MWRKRKRTDAFDDVFTAQKKAAAFDALRGKSSLPQGLVDRATDIVKTSQPNTESFFKHNLTTQLDTPYRQEQYRESLRLNFDEAWAAATNLHNPNATAQAGSGSSIVVSQGGMTAGESGDYLPDEDEDDIAVLMEREAKERETKRFQTVTVPLKDIIRKELLDYAVDQDCSGKPEKVVTAANKMHTILKEKQETLTNAVDELACIARKTTLLVRHWYHSCVCTSFISSISSGLQSNANIFQLLIIV